jgi:periplasmic divalent cation tolerance protein
MSDQSHFMESDERNQVVVVFCTVPSGSAHTIAGELLDKHLAACVNIFPVRSMYRWEGSLCDDSEDLLIIKTCAGKSSLLTEVLVSIHPYAVPEVLCLPVQGGFSGYLSWVVGEVYPAHPDS